MITFSRQSTFATPTLSWPVPAQWPAPTFMINAFSDALSMLKRLVLTLLILLGACTLYDQAIGDGRLPRFNELASSSSISALSRMNSTSAYAPMENLRTGWLAMAHSRELLTAISPEIVVWLYDLNQKNRIEYGKAPATLFLYGKSSDTPVMAAYEVLSGKLYIGSAFWALSDGEKAAVLAHEYRHTRQNWPKQISDRLAQLASGGQLRYQSRLEAEAFDYERQARAALGLSPLTAQIPQ